MSKQDWIKEEENNLHTIWRNEKKKGTVYVSNKKGMPLINQKPKEGFLVSVWIGGIENEKRRVFSTEQQSLNYANAYMRTH